jgi:hypothetical protein
MPSEAANRWSCGVYAQNGESAVDAVEPCGYALVPMGKSVFTLFIVTVLFVGLAFALHAEDLPETPYDESQGMASEHTPFFAIRVLEDSRLRGQATQKSALPLLLGSRSTRAEIRVENTALAEPPVVVIPTILAVPLRC